jgi:hypothetical protein
MPVNHKQMVFYNIFYLNNTYFPVLIGFHNSTFQGKGIGRCRVATLVQCAGEDFKANCYPASPPGSNCLEGNFNDEKSIGNFINN